MTQEFDYGRWDYELDRLIFEDPQDHRLSPEVYRMIDQALADSRKRLEAEDKRRKREKMQKIHEKKIKTTPYCVRCGNVTRPTKPGERNGVHGSFCTDVWACERDAWELPCCQHCHEQFHPSFHTECPKAQLDPWGNRPHTPGGKFWTESQKEQVESDAEKVQGFMERMDSIGRRSGKTELIVADFLCVMCGRTKKPTRPVKCLECNRLAGFRKGYKKSELKP